jgi:hypothetical protein
MQDEGTGTARIDGEGKVFLPFFWRRIAPLREDQGLQRGARLRPLLLGILSLLCLLEARPSFPQGEPEDRFSEKLTVVERAVYIDVAALPAMGSALRKADADFLVKIDGAAVELADPDAEPPRAPAVDPAADAEPEPRAGELASVTHMIWLDADLASPAYVAGAAHLLANALPYFPTSERVSLVEMGRDSSRVLEDLSRTELLLWLRRRASRAERGHAPPPTTAQRIAALNRLAIGLPRLSTQDLGALWLISEPWALEPSELEEILRTEAGEAPGALERSERSEGSEPAERSARGTLERTSRILAADGWVVFPVAARNLDRPKNLAVPGEGVRPDGFTEKSPSPRADRPVKAIPVLISRLFGKRFRQKSALQRSNLAQTLALATEIRLAPVAALARSTTGSLVGDPLRMGHVAQRLRTRRRLVVKDPDPGGFDLRRLEVVWLGGDGRAVPALPWVASRTPREIGIARLLSVVETSAPAAGQLLRVRAAAAAEGRTAELCFAYPRSSSPVRLLRWRESRQAIEVEVPGRTPDTGDAGDGRDGAADGSEGCTALPGDLDDADVVVLESLDSTEWGAGRVSALRASSWKAALDPP